MDFVRSVSNRFLTTKQSMRTMPSGCEVRVLHIFKTMVCKTLASSLHPRLSFHDNSKETIFWQQIGCGCVTWRTGQSSACSMARGTFKCQIISYGWLFLNIRQSASIGFFYLLPTNIFRLTGWMDARAALFWTNHPVSDEDYNHTVLAN